MQIFEIGIRSLRQREARAAACVGYARGKLIIGRLYRRGVGLIVHDRDIQRAVVSSAQRNPVFAAFAYVKLTLYFYHAVLGNVLRGSIPYF